MKTIEEIKQELDATELMTNQLIDAKIEIKNKEAHTDLDHVRYTLLQNRIEVNEGVIMALKWALNLDNKKWM